MSSFKILKMSVVCSLFIHYDFTDTKKKNERKLGFYTTDDTIYSIRIYIVV